MEETNKVQRRQGRKVVRKKRTTREVLLVYLSELCHQWVRGGGGGVERLLLLFLLPPLVFGRCSVLLRSSESLTALSLLPTGRVQEICTWTRHLEDRGHHGNINWRNSSPLRQHKGQVSMDVRIQLVNMASVCVFSACMENRFIRVWTNY